MCACLGLSCRALERLGALEDPQELGVQVQAVRVEDQDLERRNKFRREDEMMCFVGMTRLQEEVWILPKELSKVFLEPQNSDSYLLSAKTNQTKTHWAGKHHPCPDYLH